MIILKALSAFSRDTFALAVAFFSTVYRVQLKYRVVVAKIKSKPEMEQSYISSDIKRKKKVWCII